MTLTPAFDFDEIIERRGTDSVKYDVFDDPDVLSLWVADMDFRSPPSVIDGLRQRIDHGVFGYTFNRSGLKEVICQRLADRYNWTVQPDEIVLIPGVVAALNAALRAVGQPGDNMLIQTPIYPPFLQSPAANGMTNRLVPLVETERDGYLHYEIDFDAFEAAIDDDTKLFALCHPHNPTGRMFTREELTRMAEICIKHDVVICSDEIHGDLVFQDHVPTASISPEISQHTITLMAPSKTYNIPSLGFSFAIIQNPDLRHRFEQAEAWVVPHVGVMGLEAAYHAYTGGDDWLAAVIAYLRENRDLAARFIRDELPGIRTTYPEGTYLLWLDCRTVTDGQGETGGDPMAAWIEPFFLHKAKVALNNGRLFGEPGNGYARLNFAMPRARLVTALERMKAAVGG